MGPFGAHGALWGISEAIPSGWSLRVDGYSEWLAIPNGWLTRNILPLGQLDSSRFQAKMILGATSGRGWTCRVCIWVLVSWPVADAPNGLK